MIKLAKRKLIACLIVILCVLSLAGVVTPTRKILLLAFKFPLRLCNLAAEEFNAAIFYHRNYIQAKGLRKENELLKNQINSLNELYIENTRLKEILSLKQISPFQLAACKVIGRDPSNWASSIIVDKGRKDGIKKNQLVITAFGVAGKVTEVGLSVSKITLVNDPDFNIPAVVRRSRQEGMVSGMLQKSLTMRYIDYDADIIAGDTVVTSGFEGMYPKGIVIGRVIGFGRDATGLSRHAIIEPAVDVYRLEEVLVIIK